MSTRQDGAPSPPIGSRNDLVEWFAVGCKPRADWRIGTEHEKIAFRTDDLAPVPYEGPRGIRAIMEELIQRYGWLPIHEGDNIIALKRPDDEPMATVSLEPGGQFELSGAPLATLHEVAAETQLHLDQVSAIGKDLGIGFLGVGFSPKWRLDETPRMPKRRYAVMTRYMPKVGAGGLEMMYRTATIQVNLDFASEADMVQKLRVSLALQPIATAVFAASPFKEGRPNGFLSLRSEVWRDTDRQRTGLLPFVFENGMSFDRYVEYALDVPMYFIYRDGQYIDVAGASFRDFMAGRLAEKLGRPELKALEPTMDDWSDHITTIFPEVRMKRFLEMRGADGGRWRRICALPAFWVGLLYDQTALDAAWDVVKGWSAEERDALRTGVPRTALATPFRRMKLLDIAREVTAISREGLKARGIVGTRGDDERVYLDPVGEIVASGRTIAEDLLEAYEKKWGRNIDRIFTEFAF
ncbi:MAG: glutamate--cysteine ligase [Hyphomicrobiaceae bacterium]|nr:glutamate--cysteine ligase [Hyphomicrobiaceae bacterium]